MSNYLILWFFLSYFILVQLNADIPQIRLTSISFRYIPHIWAFHFCWGILFDIINFISFYILMENIEF